MSDRNSEDIIGALYDMVQDARSMPLAADKCILERDKVLDMLDEIIAQLPAELKQSRTIVESRNELISQARREAESIVRQAQEQSKQMVTKEAIYVEAKKRSEELVGQTQAKIEQLRKAGKGIKLSQRGADGCAGVICQQRLQRRHLLERTQQRQAVAGVECIIGHLGQDALHVVYVSQDIIQALGKNMVVIQRGYGV